MFSNIRQEVSNWASYNICFSKAALFISGLVFSHAFVEHAFFSVLMSFITSNWESYNLPKVAAIVNAYEGVSIFFAIMVAYLAEKQFNRFKVVLCTTAAFFTGLVILCFHQSGSSIIFYLALLLVSLGKGGRSPTLKAFLQDQFDPNPEMEEANQRVEARQQFWWRSAWFLGALVPTIISSILPMEETIVMISTIITGAASLFFSLGIQGYNKEHQRLEINNRRGLLNLIPIWLTFLIYCLVEAAGSTFFLEQSDNLDDKIGNVFRIPLTFFTLLSSFTSFLTSKLVDFIVSKLWRIDQEVQRKRAFLLRISIGMLVSFLCCITAWRTEVRRLELIKEFGISSSNDENVPMNILWLTPQFLLLGLTTGLVQEGMEGCFYNLVPGSMRLHELPFNKIVMVIGKSVSILTIFVFRGWFGDSSDVSRLDKYFLMLAAISIGSLAFFIVSALYACYWKIAPAAPQEGTVDALMEEGLAQGNPFFDEPLENRSLEMMAEDEGTIEMVIQRSRSQHLTEESSTERLIEGAASPSHFFSQGDSVATRPSSSWIVVRESLWNRRFKQRK